MDIKLITVKRFLDERKEELLRHQARESANFTGYEQLTMTSKHAEELFEVESAIRAFTNLANCYHIRMGTKAFNGQISLCGYVLSDIDRALPKDKSKEHTDIINTHLYLALENLKLALAYLK